MQHFATVATERVRYVLYRALVKSVLKFFLPTLNNIDELELPRERCAEYMWREELKTVSMAHKAYILAETKTFILNSDTTKFQKKLGVSANGMLLCLSEVPDGSAQSMIE